MATQKKKTARKAVAKKRIATARKTTALTRRQVVAQLKKGISTITFRKQDGTSRVMAATLNSNEVPGTLTKVESNGGDVRGVVTVWDVENNGFRSFRLDNLKRIRPQQAQR